MRNFREMLLVAWSALLLLLLIAALPQSTWRDTACRASLAHLYSIAKSYATDYQGYVVPGIFKGHGNWKYWPSFLVPYTDDFQKFSCPANRQRGELAYETWDLVPHMFSLRNVSYGINYFITSTGLPSSPQNPYKFHMVATPSYVVFLGDAKTLELRATKWCWLKDWNPLHKNGANYVMADGHVEYFAGKTPGLYDKIAGWHQDTKRWRNWKR